MTEREWIAERLRHAHLGGWSMLVNEVLALVHEVREQARADCMLAAGCDYAIGRLKDLPLSPRG